MTITILTCFLENRYKTIPHLGNGFVIGLKTAQLTF